MLGPPRRNHSSGVGLFGLNILAVGAGTIYMWPSEASNWWDREEVREGLGLIITTVALLLTTLTLWRSATVRAQERLAETVP
jgi:hypothetical protein